MNKIANTKTIAEIFLYMILLVIGVSIVFNPWVGGSNPLFYLAIMFMIFAFFSFVAYFIGRKEGDYELILLSLVNVVISVFLYYFKEGNIPMLLSFSLSSWSFFYITLKLITAFQYRDINYKKHSIKMFITAIIFVLSVITVFSLFTDDIILGLSLYGYYYIIVAGLRGFFMDTENIKEKIEQIDKETFKIFCDVCEKKEISAYKNYLLNAKLDILESSLETTLITLLNTETYKVNKLIKKQKLLIALLFVALIIFFFNPLIGAGLNIFCIWSLLKINKKGMSETLSIEDTNSYLEKVKTMETMFQNCRRFLKAHTNYEIESFEEELQDESLRKIDLANEHIEISVMNGGISSNIPPEIQTLMVSMLQSDLQTDEQDLEKLMHMVIEKELGESLENNGGMTRIREKNSKNEEK